jgi:GNAT superfamily N-acetyltransferase
VNVDFTNYVALIAVVEEEGRRVIVGGGRYIVVRLETAEVAVAVVDEYQRQGIGSTLMRHLAALARDAGLKELIAEVLADNIPMLKVFEKSGLRLTMQ